MEGVTEAAGRTVFRRPKHEMFYQMRHSCILRGAAKREVHIDLGKGLIGLRQNKQPQSVVEFGQSDLFGGSHPAEKE